MGGVTSNKSHLVGCLSLAVFELKEKKKRHSYISVKLCSRTGYTSAAIPLPPPPTFSSICSKEYWSFFSEAERSDRFQVGSQLHIICLPPIFLAVVEALSFGLYLPEVLLELQNPIPSGRALQDSSQVLGLTLSRTTPETQKGSCWVLALEYPQIPSVLGTEPLFLKRPGATFEREVAWTWGAAI